MFGACNVESAPIMMLFLHIPKPLSAKSTKIYPENPFSSIDSNWKQQKYSRHSAVKNESIYDLEIRNTESEKLGSWRIDLMYIVARMTASWGWKQCLKILADVLILGVVGITFAWVVHYHLPHKLYTKKISRSLIHQTMFRSDIPMEKAVEKRTASTDGCW